MRTSSVTAVGDTCSRCSATLVAAEPCTVPWCPQCELGLDTFDPSVAPWRGTRWLSRWGFRRAFALDDELRSRIRESPDSAAERSRAETVLVAASALITLFSLAAFTTAVAVWFVDDWLPPARFFASVALVLIGCWLRPRFGRLPRKIQTISPHEAPALRSLVRDVAAAGGAQEPDVLILTAETVNMAVTRVGVRGRSVLVIGIPMWLLLTPAMRIAVLAHELGHLTNDDPLRSTLTRPATTIFARAVEWTGGHNPWRAMGDRLDRADQDSLLTMLFRLVLAVVNTVFATIQLAIDAVVMADHRRAEYAADLAARQTAGTAATVAAFDRFTVLDDLVRALVHDVVSTGPTGWLALADRRHELLQDEMAVRRQASRRTVDLWVTHPSSGSRAQLIEALPVVEPAVPADPDRFARIDAELRHWYAASHREILGTREFLG